MGELLCASATAQQPAYPTKPIRMVLTISGGGETNARVVMDRVSQALGVPIVVDAQAPAAFLSTPAVTNGNTNNSPISFNLAFKNVSSGGADPVTGLTLSDLVVSGGTASNLQGSGTSYTFETDAGWASLTVSAAGLR